MDNYTKQTFKIFWQHARVYWLSFLVVSVSIMALTATDIVTPLFYKEFFNILIGPLIIADKVAGAIGVLMEILTVCLVGWIFGRLASFFNSYFQTKVMTDLSNTCFAYLHKHSINFFNNNFVGSLVKRVNRFSRAFEGIADSFCWELLPIIVNIILIVVILAQNHLLLGLAVLVWVVVYCLMNYFFSLHKLKYDIVRSELDSKVTGILADTITNHLNIKLFTGYDREREYFKKTTDDLRKIRLFSWNLGNIFEAAQVLLMIILEIGMFYYAVKLFQRGRATIGDFVLIQSYMIIMFNRLWNFGRVIRHYYEHLADAKEMTEILEKPHEIKDAKRAKDLVIPKGKIEFMGVSFCYNQTRRIINDLNLTFAAKKRTALVGFSGSGKSTIVNLLLRNYEIEKGKILIDGQKISGTTLASLWQNISLVPQDPILFHRTLKENIRYGRPAAADEEVFAAAKLAHCHQFISGFPDGYETYVGERGVKLSSGERQRVAIARAILKNAPILVLDEATSSLDSESEKLIQDALEILMKDKTVIVIAHRLSTIMKMDNIVVLKGGRVIEQGTHLQLIKKQQGVYKRLWEKQIGGFIR